MGNLYIYRQPWRVTETFRAIAVDYFTISCKVQIEVLQPKCLKDIFLHTYKINTLVMETNYYMQLSLLN